MKKRYITTDEQARRVLLISRDEYALLDYIVYRTNPSFTDYQGYCSDRLVTIASEIGISERGLFKMLKRLQESDLIEKHPVKSIYRATQKWYLAHSNQFPVATNPGQTETGAQAIPNYNRNLVPQELYSSHQETGTQFMIDRNQVPMKPELSSVKEEPYQDENRNSVHDRPEPSSDETGTQFMIDRNQVPMKPELSSEHNTSIIENDLVKSKIDFSVNQKEKDVSEKNHVPTNVTKGEPANNGITRTSIQVPVNVDTMQPHEVEALAWEKLSQHFADPKRRKDIANFARFDGDFDLQLNRFFGQYANNLSLMSDFARGIGFNKFQGWLATAGRLYQRQQSVSKQQIQEEPIPDDVELTPFGIPLNRLPNR